MMFGNIADHYAQRTNLFKKGAYVPNKYLEDKYKKGANNG